MLYNMSIFDGHCDVLFKMWEKKDRTIFYQKHEELQASFERLRLGGVKVQTMAVFVPAELPKEQRHYAALEMIDILHHEVLDQHENVQLLTTAEQLKAIDKNDGILYILLSLEGADALQGDLTYLRTYYQLGMRSLGLTWNYRNEVADGVLERNPAGLSTFGFALIEELNRLRIAIDTSHLAEKGFWDCVEVSKQPIMASHSNARALFDHPRNLNDEQIKAIFKTEGLIGINFVPYFYTADSKVKINDVLKHIDYLLSLGGEDYVGFGSDFDGISKTIQGLENATQWTHFAELLHRHYPDQVVQKLLFNNWKDYYLRLWD